MRLVPGQVVEFGKTHWRLYTYEVGDVSGWLKVMFVPASECDDVPVPPITKEAKPVNKVEKGQKYKDATGSVREVIADPFIFRGKPWVAIGGSSDYPHTVLAERLGTDFHLIREPKFKVGDKVNTTYAKDLQIVAVTSEPDRNGEFWYTTKDSDGDFTVYDDRDITGKVSS